MEGKQKRRDVDKERYWYLSGEHISVLAQILAGGGSGGEVLGHSQVTVLITPAANSANAMTRTCCRFIGKSLQAQKNNLEIFCAKTNGRAYVVS